MLKPSLAHGFREAPARMLAKRGLLTAFAVAALVLGIGAATLPPSSSNGFDAVHTMVSGTDCLLVLVFFFILADAVRTERPEFVMTFRVLISWLAKAWLSIAAIAAGIAFFVLPGVYAAVKLVPWTAYYFLGDDQPLQHTLRDTTGYFWETCALLVFLWLFPQLALIAAALIAVLSVVVLPICAIVATPLFVLCGCYVLTVACLVWIRYSAALRRAGGSRLAAIALLAIACVGYELLNSVSWVTRFS
jgi:hypothetical protein